MRIARFNVRSQVAFWLLLLLPLIIQLPSLTGHWNPDPSLFVGGLGDSFHYMGSFPWIDPNNGFQSQALGKLAADQWLHGQVPWWNSFNGVGLPLAAEGSPGALFLPFVLLYHYRDAVTWVEVLLQIIAGISTYLLCRKLNLTTLAAFASGMLFEFNGTFAWHGAPITSPVAFLPMLLLGMEYLHDRISHHKAGGWLLISIALAWSLYSGFPETAYINGLLAVVWAFARLGVLDRSQQRMFLGSLVLAVFVGLLCSLPFIVPFAEYLQRAFIGGHDGAFAHVSLPGISSLLSVMPWLFGPIDRFNAHEEIMITWSSIGGYTTALQISLALLGAMVAPRRLGVALLGWMFLCLTKSYDWQPFSNLVNFLPMVKSAAFFRYSPPSWELCGSLLVAFLINGLQKKAALSRARELSVLITVLSLICLQVLSFHHYFKALLKTPHYPFYFYASIGWLFVSIFTAAFLIGRRHHWRRCAYAIVFLLFVDAGLAFALPVWSGAREVNKDEPGIAFLQAHLGLYRFHTLGPVAPNYGAYYKIAQINHNQLPIVQDWVDYTRRNLAAGADAIVFVGRLASNDLGESGEPEIQRRRKAFEEVAVKYVVTTYGTNPFVNPLKTQIGTSGNKPLPLKSGHDFVVQWHLPAASAGSVVTDLAVTMSNYTGTADGVLRANVCFASGSCASGRSSLRGAADNAPLTITLDHPLQLPQTVPPQLTIALGYEQSNASMAIWVWPVNTNATEQLSMGDDAPGFAPAITLGFMSADQDGAAKLVYSKQDMNIYELPKPKPYFEVLGGPCTLRSLTRVLVEANCSSRAELLRRELFYPGWQVRVNGSRVPLERANEIFQRVDLSAGEQTIAFEYKPSHFLLIELGFGLGLLGLLFAAWLEWRSPAAKFGVATVTGK